MKTITKIEYVAEDGEVFDNKEDCSEYEKRISDGGIYLFGGKITMAELRDYMCDGYWLSNYSPGRLVIFSPPPYSGGYGNIYGDIADKLGKIHDPYNYRVYQNRMKQNKGKIE